MSFPLIGLLALSSAGANCEEPAETADTPRSIRMSWSLERDGEPLTCEEVRGGNVRLKSTPSRVNGLFQCSDGEGIMDGPEPGTYDLTLSLWDEGASDIILAKVDISDVTTTEDPLDLGHVVLEMVAERCQGWDDDRDGDEDCDDSDCADEPECATAAEDCGAEGDEDQDGDADCEDADCDGDPACEEEVCNAAEVTIAAVYTRGGAGGAAYKGDFVVLENRTDTDYDLTGHSLQTATILLTNWDVFALPAESIPANGAYLVSIGTPGSQGADLPTPDEAFDGAGNLNDTAQLSVALMPTAAALTACPTTAIDLFSAGEEACAEGTTVAPPGTDDPTEWYARGGDGCTDSDDNAADFTVETAGTPRNSASATVTCTCP